jgi:hypothetical protein
MNRLGCVPDQPLMLPQRAERVPDTCIAAAAAAAAAAEETFDSAMQELVSRGYLGADQLVALVMSGRKPIWRSASTHSIQVRGGGGSRIRLLTACDTRERYWQGTQSIFCQRDGRDAVVPSPPPPDPSHHGRGGGLEDRKAL